MKLKLMKSKLWIKTAGVITFASIGSFQALANTDSDQAQTDLIPVSVQKVEYAEHAKAVISSGIVKPLLEQTLAFKVPGIISRVLVREGQKVKSGTALVQLDSEAIDAQLAKAEALFVDAQRQHKRFKTLEGQQVVSDEQSRQAQTSLQVAKADLRIARFNKKHSVITAPSSGQVLTRLVEPNELIQAGQPAFIFADAKQGWSVRLSVADIDVVKLRLGDRAKIKLDAYPAQEFDGVVSEIAGRADTRSQTFEIDIAIKKAPKLYSGLIAHAQIEPGEKQSLSKVPLSALIQANGHKGQVYVVDAMGELQLKDITIAYLDSAHAMVSQGLEVNERLIVQGGAFIRQDTRIRIINPPELEAEPESVLKPVEGIASHQLTMKP